MRPEFIQSTLTQLMNCTNCTDLTEMHNTVAFLFQCLQTTRCIFHPELEPVKLEISRVSTNLQNYSSISILIHNTYFPETLCQINIRYINTELVWVGGTVL